jgi:hypothetical protein
LTEAVWLLLAILVGCGALDAAAWLKRRSNARKSRVNGKNEL